MQNVSRLVEEEKVVNGMIWEVAEDVILKKVKTLK